jgi:hypothetical protein
LPIASTRVLTRILRRAGELENRLPVVDGYELAARLRERLTSYGREADKTRSKATGFDLQAQQPRVGLPRAKPAHG